MEKHVSPTPPPAKVLMVLYYYHPYVSGVSVSAKRLAERLAADGYRVTVLTSRYDNQLPKKETINGVNVLRRPVILKINKGIIMPTFWWDMIRLARRHDFVNPHLPMAESGWSSLFIPKSKIFTTYQCDIFLGNGWLDRLIAAVSTALMKLQLRRSRVVVPSTMDYLRHSKMKRYVSKAQAIYPTLNDAAIQPLDPAPLFKKLGLSKHGIKIGFVGRVVYEKGIVYLLQAIPHLQRHLKDFKVIIVGDYMNVAGGSVKDQLDHFLMQYPDTILFTGFLDDADRNRFYSGIDVLVLPSIDPLEAYGLVQVEAMLCGAPVVASNLPGVREIIKRSGYGRIAKIRDPADIARHIAEVVSHPKAYRPARPTVVRLFGERQSVDRYKALMRGADNHHEN